MSTQPTTDKQNNPVNKPEDGTDNQNKDNANVTNSRVEENKSSNDQPSSQEGHKEKNFENQNDQKIQPTELAAYQKVSEENQAQENQENKTQIVEGNNPSRNASQIKENSADSRVEEKVEDNHAQKEGQENSQSHVGVKVEEKAALKESRVEIKDQNQENKPKEEVAVRQGSNASNRSKSNKNSTEAAIEKEISDPKVEKEKTTVAKNEQVSSDKKTEQKKEETKKEEIQAQEKQMEKKEEDASPKKIESMNSIKRRNGVISGDEEEVAKEMLKDTLNNIVDFFAKPVTNAAGQQVSENPIVNAIMETVDQQGEKEKKEEKAADKVAKEQEKGVKEEPKESLGLSNIQQQQPITAVLAEKIKEIHEEQSKKVEEQSPKEELKHSEVPLKKESLPQEKKVEETKPENEEQHDENQQAEVDGNEVQEKKQEVDVQESQEDPSKKQQEAKEELKQSLGSILNFFTVTKDNIQQGVSNNWKGKLKDLYTKSQFKANLFKLQQDRSFLTNSPVQTKKKLVPAVKSPRTEKMSQSLKQVRVVKTNKNPEEVRNSKTLPGNEKLKTKVEAKNKNEIEEQIRQHRIQEAIKLKESLEAKLLAVNQHLVELKGPEQENSRSPYRNKSINKKETKEEALEKRKKAVEFSKKMLQEQKSIEQRNQNRRDLRSIVIMKEMEALQQQQAKNAQQLRGAQAFKSQLMKQGKSKPGAMFSALEERKQELREKRDLQKQGSGEETSGSHSVSSGIKNPKKVAYESPMLPTVLAMDDEQKKSNFQKASQRKELKERQVEYAREVKHTFLPKIPSKFDKNGKLKQAIRQSQDIEEYMIKAGKSHIYEYLKRKEHAPYKGSPTKSRVNVSKREESSRSREEEEEPVDYANVRYGKELVNELQGSWDGTRNTGSTEENERLKDVRRSQPVVRGQYQKKDIEVDEDLDKLNQELAEEQTALKDKISGMLNDIKQMEMHVKEKEDKLLKGMEKYKASP